MIERPLTSNNNNIVQILFTTVLGFSILTQSFWTKTKNIERTHDTDWMKELTNLSTKLWKRFFCIINPTSTKAKIKEGLLVLFILFIYFYFYYYFAFCSSFPPNRRFSYASNRDKAIVQKAALRSVWSIQTKKKFIILKIGLNWSQFLLDIFLCTM
jgi:hypothetical protein